MPDTTPRIAAYVWSCSSCSWEQLWPLSKQPSVSSVHRAYDRAKRELRCGACGGEGSLSVFWTNGWAGSHEKQLAKRAEWIAEKQNAKRSSLTRKILN